MWEDDDGIVSPCIRICAVDKATGWCRGCYRTLHEISYWTRLTAMQKHALLARCGERRRQHPVFAPINE